MTYVHEVLEGLGLDDTVLGFEELECFSNFVWGHGWSVGLSMVGIVMKRQVFDDMEVFSQKKKNVTRF